MIRNYFRIAFRNIFKRKLYSFIHVFGLSVSMACCLLIALLIRDENSFDRFHVNKERIYRIEDRKLNLGNEFNDDEYISSAWLQAAMGLQLSEQLPDIEYFSRFSANYGTVMRYGDKLFAEQLTYVDPDFFKMFSFSVTAGNSEKLLRSMDEIVLTQALAKKYFGNEDPIGKTVLIGANGEKSFTVSGVVADPPANSSLEFTMLIRQEHRSNYDRIMALPNDSNTPVFVQLSESASAEKFNEDLQRFLKTTYRERYERWEQERIKNKIGPEVTMLSLDATPLTEIHLKRETYWHKVSDRRFSYILGGIAALIVIIACVNYVALALTGSAARRKEVGVRKITGARRGQLIRQFAMESFLMVLISMAFAFALAVMLLPSLNDLTMRGIVIGWDNALMPVLMAFGISLVVAALAGSYPALYLSSLIPVQILKGAWTSRLQSGLLRSLVVLQFILSSFLIISSIAMNRQMEFIASKDLGYDKDQLIVVPTQAGWNNESNMFVEKFRTALQHESSVSGVAGTSTSFGGGTWRHGFKYLDQEITAYIYAVDDQYIPVVGLDLLYGRNFNPLLASDSSGVIVNEAMVRAMKWNSPVGQLLPWRKGGGADRVIGVVKDYNFYSLEREVEPVILSVDKKYVGYLVNMFIKVNPLDMKATIGKIESAWHRVAADKPFEYTFVDETVARQYQAYTSWTSLMTFAAAVGIMIAGLGLFGLSGMNAVSRTKEIGIRKALGAELASIVVLLNRQYVWLAGIAFLITVPAAAWAMNKWLSAFEFRISIDAGLIAIALLGSLMVVVLSVSYHSLRTAMMKPSDVLKSE